MQAFVSKSKSYLPFQSAHASSASAALSRQNNAATKRDGETGAFHNFGRLPLFDNGLRASVQPKLMVNSPRDAYEQEADGMAERVTGMHSPQVSFSSNPNRPNLQRQSVEYGKNAEAQGALMRKTAHGMGFEAPASLTSQLSNTNHGGFPLPHETRHSMERAFDADFSTVRIHTDSRAREMSQGIQARAFTHGSDIYFNHEQYNPGAPEGRRLLGHELTHTLQQSAGKGQHSIQREGGEEKKGTPKKEEPVKTEIEVVTEHDFKKNETTAAATTTRTAEQKVTDTVTAKTSEKTAGEGTTGTAELKVKDKASGLSAAGGIKAFNPADPLLADTAKGFIKVGGQWVFFNKQLQLGVSGGLEYDFKKTPKVSLDGKFVFFPNGTLTPEIAAGLTSDDKGVSGKIEPSLTFRITESLSLKAGVPIEIGPGNKLVVKGGAGFVVEF